MSAIISSKQSDPDMSDTNPIFTPNELNLQLLNSTKLIAAQYKQVTIVGDIASVKIWKRNTGASFQLVYESKSFSCKVWANKGTIDLTTLESLEHTSCHVSGSLQADHFYGHKFSLSVDDITPLNNDGRIQSLKKECANRGYFEKKKALPDWTAIRHVGLISKRGSQGYNDFLQQFHIPLRITLKEITLEGTKTASECIEAINSLQDVDIILIVRGGGATNEISNSFDVLTLFETITHSQVPVITAIGHEADKGDKLLITSVSDKDYPTPSTAAVELSKLFLHPILDSIQSTLRSMEDEFESHWQKKFENRLARFEKLLSDLKQEQFGGDIVSVEDGAQHLIIEQNNRLYKIELALVCTERQLLNVNDKSVQAIKTIEEHLDNEDFLKIQKLLLSLKPCSLIDKLLSLVTELTKLLTLQQSFEDAVPKSNAKLCGKKYTSKNLKLKTRVNWYQLFLWYKTQFDSKKFSQDMFELFMH